MNIWEVFGQPIIAILTTLALIAGRLSYLASKQGREPGERYLVFAAAGWAAFLAVLGTSIVFIFSVEPERERALSLTQQSISQTQTALDKTLSALAATPTESVMTAEPLAITSVDDQLTEEEQLVQTPTMFVPTPSEVVQTPTQSGATSTPNEATIQRDIDNRMATWTAEASVSSP